MKKILDEDNDEEVEEENDDVEEADDDVEDDDNEDESDDEEETYLESITNKVVDLHDDIVSSYVIDPETPEELTQNESTKKFLIQQVRKRLLDSYESHLQWAVDDNLLSMMKKCKRQMSVNDELDALTAMKRIINKEDVIEEIVEAAIEEQIENADDEDDTQSDNE
jgi:hypothetical protein